MKELLIERWFPVREASIESGRERGAQFPPLVQLHVWWSRKPMAASRISAILAALPSDAYEGDFSKLLSALGLMGDPVKAQEQGTRSYGYPLFEGVNPSPDQYMDKVVDHWGRRPVGADLMAGGGSIPFEMARVGYGKVIAGEYNPVAYTILKGALEYPMKYRGRLLKDYEAYGRQLLRSLRSRVKDYFPPHPQGQPLDYVWARVFRCPECGCEIPSLISLWLDREKGFALYPVDDGVRIKWKVVKVEEAERRTTGGQIESTVRVIGGEYDGRLFETRGYVHRGVLECPRHRHTVKGDEVKRQYREYILRQKAEGYRVSHPDRLVAAVLKGRVYVDPTQDMIKASEKAKEDLRSNFEMLLRDDLIPSEVIPDGEKTIEPLRYGISHWYGLFNARQLLVHAEIVRLIRELRDKVFEDELRKGKSKEEAADYSAAITTYLTLALGKTLNFNTILTSWIQSRGVIRSLFQMHAFAWTWTYGEGDMIHVPKGFYQWALNNVKKSLKGLVKRLLPVTSGISVVYGDASSASFDEKLDIILTDPPYYDSIQYGELSDFFYVWFKKTLKEVHSEAYNQPETPKQDEVVSNKTRHGTKKLAARAYEEKIGRIFRNHRRILRDEGVFALWFAHKSGEAWRKTIKALLDSGFTITSLWGVNTEMARSLHIAGNAALRTNIIMTCRKRTGTGGYIQDARQELETSLQQRLEEVESYGIQGPDFLMAAQAEALKVASKHWPLKDPQGKLTPDKILEHLMDQSVGHAVNHLTRKAAPQIIGVDAPTKFYVLTKYLYGDEAPYDEARRIALACIGASGESEPVDEVAVRTGLGKLASTQVSGERAKMLSLTEPWERVRQGKINKEQSTIDYVHRAVAALERGGSAMEAAEELAGGGGAACEVIRALYEILPDRVQKGRGTTINKEKLHLQTLVLSVCQEGLHRVAQRRQEEDETQRRLDQYRG